MRLMELRTKAGNRVKAPRYLAVEVPARVARRYEMTRPDALHREFLLPADGANDLRWAVRS